MLTSINLNWYKLACLIKTNTILETKNNNLDTFRILFLIKGILILCFSLFFILYAGIGFIFSNTIQNLDTSKDIPFDFGWIFIIIGSIGLVLSITLGVLTLLTSTYIKAEKHYNFIFAMALINCFTGILGILLGIFTLIELTKPEVKERFNTL